MLIRAAVSFVIVAVLLVMAIAFSTSKGLGGNSLTEALAFLGGQLFHGLMALTVLVAALEVMSTISCLLQLFLIGASGFDFITVYSFRLRFSPKVFACCFSGVASSCLAVCNATILRHLFPGLFSLCILCGRPFSSSRIFYTSRAVST